MIDRIMRIFDPVISYTNKNYENNYLLYILFGGFLLLLVVIGYVIFKAIT